MTLRSAAKGVIDYSKVDLHSVVWWKRWRYMLKSMTEIEHGELLRMAYDLQLALVSNSKISPEDFSKVQRDAKDTFLDIESVYKPWLGRSKDDRETREYDKFRKDWETLAGFSLDDEKAVEEWEEGVRKIADKNIEDNLEEEREREQAKQDFAKRLKEVEERRRLQQQGRFR